MTFLQTPGRSPRPPRELPGQNRTGPFISAAEAGHARPAPRVPGTRPLHGEPTITDLPVRAVGRAARLAGAVHEGGPADVAAVLQPLSRQELLELAVALAAMVPTEYSPGDLLAWNDRRYTDDVAAQYQAPLVLIETAKGNRRALQPHGTHAAFNRHRKRGETPCTACWSGERDFQRERARRRRGVA